MLLLHLFILTTAVVGLFAVPMDVDRENRSNIVKKVLDSNVSPVNENIASDKKSEEENIEKNSNVKNKDVQKLETKSVEKLEIESNNPKLEESAVKKEEAIATQNTAHIEKTIATKLTKAPGVGGMHAEESTFNEKIPHMSDEDFTDSTASGFYFFAGLSGVAIVFIMLKIYRMRLSRAERKYGVQGDRTTQELTPLPVSIEDVNSDEEDHTLFEINRQQIRIL